VEQMRSRKLKRKIVFDSRIVAELSMSCQGCGVTSSA
jgi:hypothetical protein